MIDYKTFKKEYLNEWVDKSQAARKAAEELANKEVKTSLRNLYKDTLIFILDEHKVEFKGENEKNPKDTEYNFFTYEEAMERFGKANNDGWRLPTKKELEALKDNYPYEFDKDSKQGIFDRRLYLPAAGFSYCNGVVDNVGFEGDYWSSTPDCSDTAWYLYFNSSGVYVYSSGGRCIGSSVRLVRDVK